MELKIKNLKTIHYRDWDAFVSAVYGRPYNFQQQDGCKGNGIFKFSVSDDYEPEDYENDTIPEVVNHSKRGVSFAAWLARDPKTPIKGKEGEKLLGYETNLWWHRNFYPDVTMIIDDLYKRGLLEEGEYTILIDW